jgi:riboflavin-specific deaminase-like protein
LRAKAERLNHLLPLEQPPGSFTVDQVLLFKLQEIAAAGPACHQEHQRPLVTLTYAQSLDGSIAARAGHPLAISGHESQTFTHSLRASHDAILVGIGTVLADNPRLNVRLVPGQNPRPILLDSRLRIPSYANVLKNGNLPWVITTPSAEASRQTDLGKLGAKVFRLPEGSCGGIDLAALLAKLGEMGITSLMVEGGAQVINSFITSRLVDQVIVTVAPVLVGGSSCARLLRLPAPGELSPAGPGFFPSGRGRLGAMGQTRLAQFARFPSCLSLKLRDWKSKRFRYDLVKKRL